MCYHPANNQLYLPFILQVHHGAAGVLTVGIVEGPRLMERPSFQIPRVTVPEGTRESSGRSSTLA